MRTTFHEEIGTRLQAGATFVSLLKQNGYTYQRTIYAGAISVVIECIRIEDGKATALKIQANEHSSRGMFERERSVLESLDHPNIIDMLGYGLLEEAPKTAEYCYLAMELGNDDLWKLIAASKSPMEEKEAALMMAGIGDAVQYSHAKSPPVLHLDIKPENIIRVGAVWKLADFNIARTGIDRGWGTKGYRSLQLGRLKGRSPGFQDDVYGLAATLYFALTGKPPDQPRLLRGLLPPSPKYLVRGISPGINRIVMAGLHPDPHWRFETAGKFSTALRNHINGETFSSPVEPWISRIIRPIRWNFMKIVMLGMSTISAVAVIEREKGKYIARENTIRHRSEIDKYKQHARNDAEIVARSLVKIERSERTARQNAEDAATQRLTKLEARYMDDMNRALNAWKQDDATTARELVATYDPIKSTQAHDFRHLEWYYLNRLISTGKLVIEFPDETRVACFSPNNFAIAVMGYSNRKGVQVGLFNSQDGTAKWNNVMINTAIRNDVIKNSETLLNGQNLAFSRDGLFVGATCRLTPSRKNWAGLIKVWELDTGREILKVTDERIAGQCIAFSPDGQSLVAGGIWKSILVCDLGHGGVKSLGAYKNELPTIAQGSEIVYVDATNHLVFSEDGKSLRISAFDAKGVLAHRNWSRMVPWPPATGDEDTYQPISPVVNQFAEFVAISPDGKRGLAQDSSSGVIRLASLNPPKPSLTNSEPARKSVQQADGSFLDVAVIGNSKIMNVTMGNRSLAAANMKGQKLMGQFAPEQGRIYKSWQISGHDGEVTSMAFSPDEQRLAITGGKKITIIDVDSEQPLASILTMVERDHEFNEGPAGRIPRKRKDAQMFTNNLLKQGTMLGQSDDGRWLAEYYLNPQDSAEQGKPEIRLYLTAAKNAGEATRRFRSPVKRIYNIGINRIGSECAISGDDEEDYDEITRSITQFGGRRAPPTRKEVTQRPLIHIIDTTNGAEKRVIRGGTSEVRWLAYLKDGRRIASATLDDRVIRIWNLDKEEAPFEFDMTSRISLSDLTPDGNALLAGSFGEAVKLWAIDSKTLLANYPSDGNTVWACQGTLVAILESGGRIRIWDLRTSRLISTINCGSRAITDLAFVGDESRIISRDETSTVAIWSVKLEREILCLPNESPTSADFRRFVAGLEYLGVRWKSSH